MITRLRALFRPFTYRARWRPGPRRNPDAIPFFFIDGLPVDITRDQIKALLAPYGTAVTVAIALRPQSDFLSFAFVVMATQAEADKARAALNGSHMLPHTMFRLGSSLSPPFGWVRRTEAGLDAHAEAHEEARATPAS